MMIQAHRRGVAGFPTVMQDRLALALSRRRDATRIVSPVPLTTTLATRSRTTDTTPTAPDTRLVSSPDYPACDCDVRALAASAGATLDVSQTVALLTQCVADRATFESLLVQQGVSLEACKPWYMRRMTWLIGGGIGVAALALSFLRGR